MQSSKSTYAVWLLMIFCIAGCSSDPAVDAQTSEHQQSNDHHEHAHSSHKQPEDFASAVIKIQILNEAIRDAFLQGDMQKADPPVHEMGHVLEAVHSLAAKASFSASAQMQINDAVDSLFKSFAAIDEKLHGGTGASYSDVEAEIKPAIELLNKKANELSSKDK